LLAYLWYMVVKMNKLALVISTLIGLAFSLSVYADDAVSGAVETVGDVANTTVETAGDVTNTVVDTTGNVVNNTVDTTGNVVDNATQD
jgi:hypothetical protein